ncbi:MAG: histidine kinase [Prevotella sp.]|nr:histidine kinase [Prevotella sp.]
MRPGSSSDKKELGIYLTLWVTLFAAPLISAYIQADAAEGSFRWADVTDVWRKFAVYLVAFLIHNFLLAPLLIYRQRRALYGGALAVLLACFIAVQCAHRPHHPEPRGPHGQEQRQMTMPPPPLPMDEWHDTGEPGRRLVGEQDIVATIMLIFMIGMNLGLKYYFRHRRDSEQLALLERRSLEQQLEYLKYQINPHFLMNTLNNIHALVDIDPEQAKESIVDLSRIMRFVLYEGSKQKVPLRQELIFLDNYIQLMRMRVADQVDISVDIPPAAADHEIPPLMLITFVENAFKHGVSYQQHSFIDISITLSDEGLLRFRCRNSKVPQGEDRHHGGVGLQNVRRRLDLIYGRRYTLDISDTADTYTVNLTLPL